MRSRFLRRCRKPSCRGKPYMASCQYPHKPVERPVTRRSSPASRSCTGTVHNEQRSRDRIRCCLGRRLPGVVQSRAPLYRPGSEFAHWRPHPHHARVWLPDRLWCQLHPCVSDWQAGNAAHSPVKMASSMRTILPRRWPLSWAWSTTWLSQTPA
jgi:hypothetical protein